MKKIIAFLFLFQLSFGQVNPEEVETADNEFETNFYEALKQKAIEKGLFTADQFELQLHGLRRLTDQAFCNVCDMPDQQQSFEPALSMRK